MPHPILFKRFIRFQMITVVSLFVLGATYALGLWINNSLLLQALDPVISIVATVAVYGLFVVPVVWIAGRSIFVKVISRRVAVELKERLQRLAVETLRRMSINPGSTRFVVGKGSSSANVRRRLLRDTISVGDELMRDASDEEIMAILGHELGHILKRHLSIKGAWNVLYFFAFLAVIYMAGQSHSSAILATTSLLALILAGVPLNWRIEYSADRFSAEKLGPSPIVSALEKLKVFYPDCASFTHPPLSRRIRRIQSLSITPLITHVYA
jgi:Zn-dependent protease with chaperone function